MNIIKDLIDYLGKIFKWWIVIMPWEQGIRVTFGKKLELLDKGIYFKLPLIHTVYVQERRLRAINLPIQTISTKDGYAITISCSVGYSINDITKLYNTLYQPDMTIQSIVASKVSEHICSISLNEISIKKIEEVVTGHLGNLDHGLKYEYMRVINFANVKTFRLIQDQTYMYEGLDLLTKK